MSKLILWLSSFILLMLAVWGLLGNPGQVSITWLGYVVETSVAFCLGFVASIALIIYLILFPSRWLKWFRTNLEKKRTNKSKELKIQILSNIITEDFKANEVLLKKLQKLSNKDDEILLLLNALSKGNIELYTNMQQNPLLEQVASQGFIEEQIKRNEIVKTIEDIEALLKKNPKKRWILNKAFSVYTLNKDWEKALDCLENLYKIKAVEYDVYKYQKAILLLQLDLGYEAFRICPSLPSAAIAAAKERPQKAEKIFFTAWAENPSFEVYQEYLKLFVKENTLSQYKHVLKLCEMNKDARLNSLVTADAAINAKLWSEAKKELDTYIANYPITTDVVAKLIRISIETKNEKETQKWLEKLSETENPINYGCEKCGCKTVTWNISCPNCNTFAGLKKL